MASTGGISVQNQYNAPNTVPRIMIIGPLPENSHKLQDTHAPCGPLSFFHDLRCGHRVKTEYQESCGTTCEKSKGHMPFICPKCTANRVRVEMDIAGLTIIEDDDQTMRDDDPSRAEQIKAIAEKEIAKLVKEHHRLAFAVPKLEPKLQFLNEIPGAQEDGGFVEDALEDAVEKEQEPAVKLKRPTICAIGKPGVSRLVRARAPDYQNLLRGGIVVKIKGRQMVVPPRGPYNRSPIYYQDPDVEELFRIIDPWTPPQQFGLPRNEETSDKEKVVSRKSQLSDRADHRGDTHDLLQEDEASRAVREVLGGLSLNERGN